MSDALVRAAESRVPSSTDQLVRDYFDTSQWNLLQRHPNRADLVFRFDRERRGVFPSVVNAAELLSDPDPVRRSDLCAVVTSLLDPGHVLLPHPSQVLQAAAEGQRQGSPSLVLGEAGPTHFFRRLLADPVSADEQTREDIKAWVRAMKEDTKEFRRELREILPGGFSGNAKELVFRPDFARLLFEKVADVRKVATAPEEVVSLIRKTAAWAAYAGSVAYEFHLLTPEGRGRPPGGPDIRQLVYTGLVNRFVLRDNDFFRAATWVAGLMPDQMHVDVISSAEYFAQEGFPLEESG